MAALEGVTASTQVTFPSGAVTGTSRVVAAVALEDGTGLVTAQTPFHPLDHTWPDQPADSGTLTVAGHTAGVRDCVTGAVEHGGGELHLGADIPARRGDQGWHWLVVHVTEPLEAPVGAPVELAVDAERRAALSAGHSACHLAALALNAALAARWRKEVRLDALGHPDFDQTAIAESRITAYGSRDVYRIGKSLRKKGFTTDALAADLPSVTDAVNGLLAAWIAADTRIWVQAPGPELTARRTWHAALPEGEASIPCGGTHVPGTARLGAAGVALELSDDGTGLTMHTTVIP
jgi:alanyl-tRNA synthetase